MADARDQKPARDAFEDARLRDARRDADEPSVADPADPAPSRGSVESTTDDAAIEQPGGDGILSSLSTFEELRTVEPGDDPQPEGDMALPFEEIKWTAVEPGPVEEEPIVGEGDDDGSIMFET